MVPEDDLEELWRWGLEKYGRNGVQTNGTLINDRHIELFKTYKVDVGVSIDGPADLNDVRWAGSLEKTREATAKAEQAVHRLLAEGLSPSLIITLHKNNATADKLPLMHEWLRMWDSAGVRSARIHILEVDHPLIKARYALSSTENVEALLSFCALEPELSNMRLDLFKDMEGLLLVRDEHASCVWRACDPYTTSAVRGVEGFGQRSNCGRTNKEGIDFVKADKPGYERYVALYHTPQEYGGCQGCRFFLMCKGQCPGTAMEGDWRNRTADCATWMTLFEQLESRLEERGIQPISKDGNLCYLEQQMLHEWNHGRNPSLKQKLDEMKQQYQQQLAAQA